MSGSPGISRWGAPPMGILSRTDQADTDISFLVGFAIEAGPPLPLFGPIAPVYEDCQGLYNICSGTILGTQPKAEFKLITLKLTSTYSELLAKVNSFNKAQDRQAVKALPAGQIVRSVLPPRIIVEWSFKEGFSDVAEGDDDGLRELLKMIVKREFRDRLIAVYEWHRLIL